MQLVDISQVAHALQVSRRTVWRLVSRGMLPQPIRLSPRLVRWRVDDLARLIEGVPQEERHGRLPT